MVRYSLKEAKIGTIITTIGSVLLALIASICYFVFDDFEHAVIYFLAAIWVMQ